MRVAEGPVRIEREARRSPVPSPAPPSADRRRRRRCRCPARSSAAEERRDRPAFFTVALSATATGASFTGVTVIDTVTMLPSAVPSLRRVGEAVAGRLAAVMRVAEGAVRIEREGAVRRPAHQHRRQRSLGVASVSLASTLPPQDASSVTVPPSVTVALSATATGASFTGVTVIDTVTVLPSACRRWPV